MEQRECGVREGEGAGWGWGAVCVSSALKRNKRTHGGSSQAGFSVSLIAVQSSSSVQLRLFSQTCNSCSALSPLYIFEGKDALAGNVFSVLYEHTDGLQSIEK